MEDGKLPIGFAFSIAQHEEALKFYGGLDKFTQNKITEYIQGSTSGDDAKERIDTSVSYLAKNNLDFLN